MDTINVHDVDAASLRKERVERLGEDAVVVRHDIDGLEAQALVDREMIDHLKAKGVVDRTKIENLESALVSARRIGAAIGILMASCKITGDQAFHQLRVASQATNRKLRDVAEDVLLMGTLSGK